MQCLLRETLLFDTIITGCHVPAVDIVSMPGLVLLVFCRNKFTLCYEQFTVDRQTSH